MDSLIDVCFCAVVVYFVKRLIDWKLSGPLPPGPSGWPVIGNLLQISTTNTWEDFAALGRIYGGVSTVKLLRTRYVILNSPEAVSEILDKQSSKCSNRPHLTMASDLAGWGKIMGLSDDRDDRFRQYRKHFRALLGSKNSTAVFDWIGEGETRRFLSKVLHNPDELLGHIRSTAGAIILKVTYGYTVQEGRDPFVELADELMKILSIITVPGAFLVDIIPALRHLPEWFPGAGFHRVAKKTRKIITEAVTRPHRYVTEKMAAGTAISSFSSTLLEREVSPEEEDIIMWISTSLFLGATDTVVATIHAFFLAMILFPEVQAKGQAEIDAVVGRRRLPSSSDRDLLPYVNAICKEVLRWHTALPLGIPHVASENIYHDGFVIPKGSWIIGNVWGILHDEDIYPEPAVFRPERFLGRMPEPDPRNVCFGFGRRSCPGNHFAEASLFTSIAMSLAVFKISKAIVDGVEVTPEVDVTSGTISHPKPFKCQIAPRSPRAAALLRGSS